MLLGITHAIFKPPFVFVSVGFKNGHIDTFEIKTRMPLKVLLEMTLFSSK